MHVPHNAVVLVADGRKLLFLRNEGDAEFPNLEVVTAQEHPNPKTSDQKTDNSGRALGTQGNAGAPNAASGGGGPFGQSRSAMKETDFHQLEEDRFAAEAADMLKKRALANEFDKLIVVAPPGTLGELRKHYHKEVSARLVGELGKDLTGHTIADIEKALVDA
jgi:protein required for attachment to host cells